MTEFSNITHIFMLFFLSAGGNDFLEKSRFLAKLKFAPGKIGLRGEYFHPLPEILFNYEFLIIGGREGRS